MIISNLIRETRLKKGMTVKEVATKVGVTEKTIYYWELGKSKIPLKSADKLFKVLGIMVTIGNGQLIQEEEREKIEEAAVSPVS